MNNYSSTLIDSLLLRIYYNFASFSGQKRIECFLPLRHSHGVRNNLLWVHFSFRYQLLCLHPGIKNSSTYWTILLFFKKRKRFDIQSFILPWTVCSVRLLKTISFRKSSTWNGCLCNPMKTSSAPFCSNLKQEFTTWAFPLASTSLGTP